MVKVGRSYNFKDLTGHRFGYLKVIGLSRIEKERSLWECLCDCGNKKVVLGGSLVSKKTKSCGCFHLKCVTERRLTHGLSKTSEHGSYKAMIKRVLGPSTYKNKTYKENNIKICSRWLGKTGPTNFVNDMGKKPKGTTLERVDNTKGYGPDNCKWATPKEQANNRSTNVMITFNGVTLNIKQWAHKIGIRYTTLQGRLKKWTIQKSFEEKLRR